VAHDADDNCCGCPDWPADYKPFAGNESAANRCYATNPDWLTVAYPWLNPYVKQACPTMYSYQYDDVTSTFTCSSAPTGSLQISKTNFLWLSRIPARLPARAESPQINMTNYTITFCPEGRTATVGATSARLGSRGLH
jgi:hypothetical protein